VTGVTIHPSPANSSPGRNEGEVDHEGLCDWQETSLTGGMSFLVYDTEHSHNRYVRFPGNTTEGRSNRVVQDSEGWNRMSSYDTIIQSCNHAIKAGLVSFLSVTDNTTRARLDTEDVWGQRTYCVMTRVVLLRDVADTREGLRLTASVDRVLLLILLCTRFQLSLFKRRFSQYSSQWCQYRITPGCERNTQKVSLCESVEELRWLWWLGCQDEA
jgi:hypothetical protein